MFETGLSDFHKLVVTPLKSNFPKFPPQKRIIIMIIIIIIIIILMIIVIMIIIIIIIIIIITMIIIIITYRSYKILSNDLLRDYLNSLASKENMNLKIISLTSFTKMFI